MGSYRAAERFMLSLEEGDVTMDGITMQHGKCALHPKRYEKPGPQCYTMHKANGVRRLIETIGPRRGYQPAIRKNGTVVVRPHLNGGQFHSRSGDKTSSYAEGGFSSKEHLCKGTRQ